MLSESQERMLVVVAKGMEAKASAICAKWDVPFTLIGEVTDDGVITVSRHGNVVAQLPAASLVLGGGAPVYVRGQQRPAYLEMTLSPIDHGPTLHENECTELLERLLAQPTIASKRWIFEQYDSQVMTNTVQRSGGDAAVIRIKEQPGKAVAVTTDCNSRYVYLNPYRGAMIAVAEAARNCACVGAVPVGVTNCLNFGNPYDPEVYWQFAEAIRGMGDACRAFDTPVTGGNVSFHNESQNHAVFPTPTIGMLGVIDDVQQTVGAAFTAEHQPVWMLGPQRSDLGGSEYLKMTKGVIRGDAPQFDLAEEVALQKALIEGIRKGYVSAAHDCAEGGLLVALAEMTFARGVGASVSIPFEHHAGHLFGEGQSRVVVEVHPEHVDAMRSLCASHGVPVTELGVTQDSSLAVDGLVHRDVAALRSIYESALPTVLAREYHS
ncbi:MAG: hypothetical protein FGM24_02040 [Candidatus Kapabacteria bacterium]|nr:hypothetical protein [Candidatus Kapabacteria bacterium]